MANNTLTASVIAKSALAILENEFGWMNKLHRAHEDEWDRKVNGYKIGDSLTIRRPADFTVRSGANLSAQDVIEGSVTLTIDKQIGIDFTFSQTDLLLKVEDMAERIMKPAMTNIINHMMNDVLTQAYLGTYNWAGTAGETINSFSDFSKGPERLDEMAVPASDRLAILSPADHWAMVGAATSNYNTGAEGSAYRKGSLGEIGGVDTYMSQLVPTHTNGTADNTTPLVKGASQTVTYDTAKTTWTMTLATDGHDASSTIKAGTVFTISGVYMVNPKTKATTTILQNFVVTADVTADGTTTNTTSLVISPPIITAGPHQTVNAAPADDATITIKGSASTGYKQNLVMHKNAMALAVVPMLLPAGAYGAARESYKGFSVRVIPGYAIATDVSTWRMDLLYGRKLIDPRLATRLSGTG